MPELNDVLNRWTATFYFLLGFLCLLIASLMEGIFLSGFFLYLDGALAAFIAPFILVHYKFSEILIGFLPALVSLSGYFVGYQLVVGLGLSTWPFTILMTFIVAGIALWLHGKRTV